MMQVFYVVLLFLGLSCNPTHAVHEKYSVTQSYSPFVSGNNFCNGSNSDIYRKISKFSSLCNISLQPNTADANILLKYKDFVPVLCMGVIESVSVICKIGFNASVIDSSPASIVQGSNLTNNVNNESLKNFCSGTVGRFAKNIKKDNNSVLTILKNELSIEANCNTICHNPNESGRVNPLCLFIVWSYNEAVKSRLPKTEKASGQSMPNDKEEKKSATATPAPVPANNTPDLAGSEDSEGTVNQESATSKGQGGDGSKKQVEPREQSPDTKTEAVNSDSVNSVLIKTVQLSKDGEIETDMIETDADKGYIIDGNLKTETVSKSSSDLKPTANPKHDADAIETVSKTNSDLKHIASMKNNADAKVKETSSTVMPTGGEATPSKTKGDSEGSQDELPYTNADGQTPGQNQVDFGVELNTVDQNKDIEGDGYVMPANGDQGSINDIVMDRPETAEDDDGKPEKETIEKSKSKEQTHKDYEDSDHEARVYFKADRFIETEDTPFFTYFLFMSVLTIVVYLVFHNKNKLVALAVEGRRKRGSRRRPNSSQYSKLHCSLEEAMASKTSSASVTHVLY